jgi:hypothetical protein
MSPNNDSCRMNSSRAVREVVDSSTHGRLARTLQAASPRMRHAVILAAIGAAVLGAALVLNGVMEGLALFCALPLALVRRKRREAVPDRAAVRLALRLARLGQRTMLVESDRRVRVVRLQEVAHGPQLQFVGALAGGALILARRR